MVDVFVDRRDSDKSTYIALGAVVLFLLFQFTFQAVVFTFERRPDEVKAVARFIEILLPGEHGNNPVPAAEIWMRLVLFAFNILVTLTLVYTGLVNRKTAVLAAIWPLSIFLFSKIYWEFFYFPFCLIRPDLSARKEGIVMGFLAVLLYTTGEANLGVLLTFRAALFLQRSGFEKSVPLGIVGLAVFLDAAMKTGAAYAFPWIGGLIQRFDWTRSIANPDYTPFESLSVFFASFHFFSLHTGAYWIDALFSVSVVVYLYCSAEFRTNLRQHLWLVLCFFSVYFFYTHVTYAFQNARYFFFFIPVLATLIPTKLFPGLALLGFFHVLCRSMEFL
jgi:hypothetical protein